MSLADDFLRDAGLAQQPTQSLADQFMADAQGPQAPQGQQRPQIQPPTAFENLLAKIPAGLVNNPAVSSARNIVTAAASPIVGGAQLLANLMPESTGVPQLYNRKTAEMVEQNKAAEKEAGPVTSTLNALAGGIASPANLAIALRAAPAVTAGQRALQGAGIGAVGGATAPVEVGESGKYWGQKGAQTLLDAGAGAVTYPLLGAIGDRVMAKINSAGFTPSGAAKEADSIISGALKDAGQRLEDLPPDQLESLRKQTVEALSKGQGLDTAAALRMRDFQSEGIKPTLGGVTRDPMQWAAEQNVRGVKGAGEGVLNAIVEGNRALGRGISQYGVNAEQPAVASQKLADVLRQYDAGKASDVGTAYATARASAGKDLEVPTAGLLDAYKQVASDFEGKIPKAVQTKFEALADQPLTFEGADKLRKVINDHVSSDQPANRALGVLRSALNNAQTQSGGGPFVPAVKLAAERFTQQESMPALAAAVRGEVDDNFIKKQIINNPSTPKVQMLADLLRKDAPEAFQEARQQIGAHLSSAAFGENAAGDKLVRPESYNKALRSLGDGKLNAFFEPAEVDQLKRLGRIASYQVAPPAGSASNYSNTASTIANLLRSSGGFLPMGRGTVQFAGDKIEASAALRPEIRVTPNLTPEQRQMMSRLLLGITGGASVPVARSVGQ